MTITYTQIDKDNIQTSETHEDGSFTSGIIRRHGIRLDAEGNEYSPWDTLDPTLVDWLDIPAFEAEQAQLALISEFKSDRFTLIKNSKVTVGDNEFQADQISINSMTARCVALAKESDSYIIQWSLSPTPTGFMSPVELGDLREALKLATDYAESVWPFN